MVGINPPYRENDSPPVIVQNIEIQAGSVLDSSGSVELVFV